ncbi:MAG: F0F1 ATP synthase subunit beta, partial [Candidatus Dojkabacteria bacterium]|nr:F0F1 ATP synthase subunit beta [Candidatus Dojkabacteria bacterium]
MKGKIVQVMGPVVDVFFDSYSPSIYEAIRVDELHVILEVQQLLDNGVVRTVAMDSTEGMVRGMECTAT